MPMKSNKRKTTMKWGKVRKVPEVPIFIDEDIQTGMRVNRTYAQVIKCTYDQLIESCTLRESRLKEAA